MVTPLIFHNSDRRLVVRRCFACLSLFLTLLGATNVYAFPQIVVPPVSAFASSDTTVSFSVGVTQLTGGQPPLSVQWRKNGANIPGARITFTNVSGNMLSTFTISTVQPADAGWYHAVVFDADGAIKTTNVSLVITNLSTLPVGNLFTNRGSLQGSFGGTGIANNFTATSETGAPSNDGIPGGALVWLKWTALGSGVATFNTRGSDFDTTLGIYKIGTNGVVNFTDLIPISGDDDEGGFFTSKARFNVAYGDEYAIGIDGYYGARGNIVLNWHLEQTTSQIPEIIQHPKSRTVLFNAPVSLSVTVNTNGNRPPLQYQWFFNGTPISGATDSSLAIAGALPTTVGQYRVRVIFSDQQDTNFAVMSKPAQVQINVEGNSHAAAEAKFHQAADPNSFISGPILNMTPVSGFTGSHIWNTYGAAAEEGEPNHCGKEGGAPYWFSYTAAADGTLTLDAYTPTFTNVLAVYTGPGDSYDTLVSAACASTNQGVGHEVAAFPATNGTTYWIVVDGLNGAVGNVTLTYSLTAPPAITTQPQSQTVPQGSNVTLTVSATGVPTPAFRWRTNAVTFTGKTNTSLSLTNFQAASQGNYDVVVTNAVGATTSSVAMLYLNSPLRLTNFTLASSNAITLQLLGKAYTNYIFQASTNLATTNWVSLRTNSSPYGIISFTDTNRLIYSNRFFRALVKTN